MSPLFVVFPRRGVVPGGGSSTRAACQGRACRVSVHWPGAYEESLIVDNFASRAEYANVGSIDPAVLAAHHAEATGVDIAGNAHLWSIDAGLEGVDALAEALRRSTIVRDVRRRINAQIEGLKTIAQPPYPPTDAEDP